MLVLATLLICCSTLLGGLLAMHVKDKRGLITGFSAGTVIGVFFFDLLPEALSLCTRLYASGQLISFVAIGFVLYLLLDRLALLHPGQENNSYVRRANLAAGGFSIHGFFDGLAVGLAYRVSGPTGLLVASAIIIHAISDGLNTITVVKRGGPQRSKSLIWLLVNTSAPACGVWATFIFQPSEEVFALLFALFAGSFLYLGASDLLPESQREHPSWATTGMTIMGMLLIYLAVHFFPELFKYTTGRQG